MSLLVKAPDSGLGQAISNIGGLVGNVLQSRLQRGRERKTGTILQEELARLPGGSSPEQFTSALSSALARGADPALIDKLGKQFTESQRVSAAQQTAAAQQQAAFQTRQKAQGAFNKQVELLATGNIGARTASPIAAMGIGPGAQHRANFGSLNLAYEDAINQAAGSKTMNKAKIEHLKQILPGVTESDQENVGRLKAVAQELGLDTSMLDAYEKSISGDAPRSRIGATTETAFTPPEGSVLLRKAGEAAYFSPENAEELIKLGWTK